MRILFFLIAVFCVQSVHSQSVPNVPSKNPKLVVVMVIDQMRYDYLAKFNNNFGKSGFNRLLAEGSLCTNARHEYLLTQQLAGYATIATGAMPSMHGIPSDKWYTRIRNEEKSAGIDTKVTAIEAKGKVNNFSPRDLLTTTFSDELILSNHHQSKIHSVAFNGRAASIIGGHAADGAWWFDEFSGKWITSSYYADSLPLWVRDFNDKKFPELYVDRKWTPKLDLNSYATGSVQGTSKTVKFEKTGFVYDILNLRKIAQSYRVLTRTPFGNTFTLDFAKQVIVNDSLGRDDFPDVLYVGLNPIGVINQELGPMSVELEDAYVRLDEDIAQFITFLDMEIGMKDVLFIMTSDRGCPHVPAYLNTMNLPADIFDQNQLYTLAKSYLNVVYGQGDWITAYSDKQFYLNHTLIEDAKLSLTDVQERLARFALQFSGVVNAVTASTLQSTNFNRGSFALMQNSYHQRRSGDVIINLEPGWIEKSDFMVQSNSGYDYDTHVPLIWYGWRVPRTTIYRNISSTSIAATIAAMLNIVTPGGSSGEVIFELMQKNR
ncbi:MAG: alkaline phosphatase family protein [Salinivirgaceae bacterium]|nr:alkaline phosphatase family protein [Salinivirgaceae bacterium]